MEFFERRNITNVELLGKEVHGAIKKRNFQKRIITSAVKDVPITNKTQ